MQYTGTCIFTGFYRPLPDFRLPSEDQRKHRLQFHFERGLQGVSRACVQTAQKPTGHACLAGPHLPLVESGLDGEERSGVDSTLDTENLRNRVAALHKHQRGPRADVHVCT